MEPLSLTIRTGSEPGRELGLAGVRTVLGRDESCDVVIEDERASRQHAAIERLPDGRLAVHDLGSTNGTLVDGRRITSPVVLEGGETIQIGNTVIDVARTGLPGSATVVGITPVGEADAPVEDATPSVVERRRLRRSVRRLAWLAGLLCALVLGGIAVGVLFGVGILGGDEEPNERTIPELVAAVEPSTVLVKVRFPGETDYMGVGTGWVLDAEKGLVVTNAHVVNVGPEHAIAFGDDERSAEIVGVAPCEDLAVLRVRDTEGLVSLPLGSQADLQQGQTVVALGYPVNAALADELTATTGIVSVVQTEWRIPSLDVPNLENVIQTDTTINPGNSGGPLVDLEGRLVGVNSAGLTSFGERPIQGQGYAIGVDKVREVLETLADGRSQLWTGAGFEFPVLVGDLSPLGLPNDVPSLLITHAVAGTPAAAAGLGEEPALVVAIDGKPLDGTFRSYCEAVEGAQSGDTATFSVIRPGETEPEEVEVGFA